MVTIRYIYYSFFFYYFQSNHVSITMDRDNLFFFSSVPLNTFVAGDTFYTIANMCKDLFGDGNDL